MGKRVWKRELVHWSNTRWSCQQAICDVWLGGDRLTTIQTDRAASRRCMPGSIAAGAHVKQMRLNRRRHSTAARRGEAVAGKGRRRPCRQPGGATAMLDRLEGSWRRNAVGVRRAGYKDAG
ncbi:hypothetical protein KCP76_20395 [Salmonella enterica subsp. enterica serovar Weltevreden]|nr:hypothetical protein KCP76_20395 [Salmonella enterica subsp. enterica serovar Weltevreden]